MKISCRDSFIKYAGPKERKRATGINFSVAEKNLSVGDKKPSREEIDAYIKSNPNIGVSNEKLNLIQQLNLEPDIRRRVNENENFFLIVGSALCSKSDVDANNSIVLINWFLEFKEASPGSLDLSGVDLTSPESICHKFNELLSKMLNAKKEADEKAADSDKSDYLSHDVVYDFGDGWVIVYLPAVGEMPIFPGLPNTSHDRIMEGNKNGLCLGSQTKYYQDNTKGKVYSLRSPGNKPEATIRIDQNTLMECKGKNNLVPKIEAARHAKAWFESIKNLNYINCYDFENFPPVDKESALESFLDNRADFFLKGWATSWFKQGIDEIDSSVNNAAQRKDPTLLVSGFPERYKEMTEPIAEDAARQYLDNPSGNGPWRVILSCTSSNIKIFRKNPTFLQAARHFMLNHERIYYFFRYETATIPEYSDLSEPIFLKAIDKEPETITELLYSLAGERINNNDIYNLFIKHQDKIFKAMLSSSNTYNYNQLIKNFIKLGIYNQSRFVHYILSLKDKDPIFIIQILDDFGNFEIARKLPENDLNKLSELVKSKILSIDNIETLANVSYSIPLYLISATDQYNIFKQVLNKIDPRLIYNYNGVFKGSGILLNVINDNYFSDPNKYQNIRVSHLDSVVRNGGNSPIREDIYKNLDKIIPFVAQSEPFNTIYMYYDHLFTRRVYDEIYDSNKNLKKYLSDNLELCISSLIQSIDIYKVYLYLRPYDESNPVYKFYMQHVFSKQSSDEWLEIGKKILSDEIISNPDAMIKDLLGGLIGEYYAKDSLSNLLQIRKLLNFAILIAFEKCSPNYKIILASKIKGISGQGLLGEKWTIPGTEDLSEIIDNSSIRSAIADTLSDSTRLERKLNHYSNLVSSLENSKINIDFINECANTFDVLTFIKDVCLPILGNSSLSDIKPTITVIQNHIIKKMELLTHNDLPNELFSYLISLNHSKEILIPTMLSANPYLLLKWIDESYNLRLNANIGQENSQIQNSLAMTSPSPYIISIVQQCISEIYNRNINVNKQYVDDIAIKLGLSDKLASYSSKKICLAHLSALSKKLSQYKLNDYANDILFFKHFLGVK